MDGSRTTTQTMIVTSLMRNPLFGEFSLSELERVAAAFFVKEFAAGTLVLQEQDQNEGLGFVDSGRLRSTKTVPNFGEKELSALGPSDVIGEVSFVDGSPHAANVRCTTDATLILSPRAHLARLFEESVDIKAKFFGIFTKTISRYLRDVNDRLHTFFQQGVDRGIPPMSRIREMSPSQGKRLERHEMVEILRGFEMFGGLAGRELELFTGVIQEVRLDRDEVIFREGARGDSLYVVARGAVRISKFFPGVGEEALTVLAPGDFFGDMSLFDDRPRSATAIGNADGTLLFSIGRGSIENLFRMNVSGGCALYELLARIQCTRLRNTINTVSFWQILVGQTPDLET